MGIVSEARITLCDHLNEGFGYQVRIVDTRGDVLLFTSRDPVSGKDLLTYEHALRVAGAYASVRDCLCRQNPHLASCPGESP